MTRPIDPDRDPDGGRDDVVRPGRTRPLDMSKDPDRFDAQQAVPPPRAGGRTGPLDMSQDPDRFRGQDATLDELFDDSPEAIRAPRIDPAADPDRYRKSKGAGQNLEEIIGRDRMYEDERSGFEWLVGLLAVLAFLGVVAYLFNSVLTP